MVDALQEVAGGTLALILVGVATYALMRVGETVGRRIAERQNRSEA